MTGLTTSELAELLKLPIETVRRRLTRAGIKPITHEAIYPPEALDLIRNAKVGRPKKP